MIYIDTNLILNVANLVFLIGTSLLIYAVIKNRVVLRGFQPVGSLLTLTGTILMLIFYIESGMFFNIFCTLVSVSFWIFATWYSFKSALKQKLMEKS